MTNEEGNAYLHPKAVAMFARIDAKPTPAQYRKPVKATKSEIKSIRRRYIEMNLNPYDYTGE